MTERALFLFDVSKVVVERGVSGGVSGRLSKVDIGGR